MSAQAQNGDTSTKAGKAAAPKLDGKLDRTVGMLNWALMGITLFSWLSWLILMAGAPQHTQPCKVCDAGCGGTPAQCQSGACVATQTETRDAGCDLCVLPLAAAPRCCRVRCCAPCFGSCTQWPAALCTCTWSVLAQDHHCRAGQTSARLRSHRRRYTVQRCVAHTPARQYTSLHLRMRKTFALCNDTPTLQLSHGVQAPPRSRRSRSDSTPTSSSSLPASPGCSSGQLS